MTSSVSGKMNRISRCDWLPERARLSYLARSGYGLCPARKINMSWCFIPYNKSIIDDQACSVKMAGYRPLFCVFMDLDFVSAINMQKKNLRNIQPSWSHTLSITHIYKPLWEENCSVSKKISCLWFLIYIVFSCVFDKCIGIPEFLQHIIL